MTPRHTNPTSRPWLRSSLLGLVMALIATAALAQSQRMTVSRTKVTPDPEQESRLPRELRDLGWNQQPGAPIPMDLQFTNHEGATVRLGDLFDGKPVILAPVYYECPMLCSLVLDGVVRGIRPLKFLAGDEFEIVAFSFDPDETPENAAVSRETTLARYGRDGEAKADFHFLVGEPTSIDALTEAIGFKYAYDEETDLFHHAGGIVLATPDGRISRYFYGVDYATKDLRLGLVEASEEKIGSLVDQVMLFCFQYDPSVGKYSAAVTNLVRAGGILTVIILAVVLIANYRRERRQQEEVPATS